MNKYIVISRNDFPLQVMPQGTTPEQAQAYCNKLQKESDEANTHDPYKMKEYFHYRMVSEAII